MRVGLLVVMWSRRGGRSDEGGRGRRLRETDFILLSVSISDFYAVGNGTVVKTVGLTIKDPTVPFIR